MVVPQLCRHLSNQSGGTNIAPPRQTGGIGGRRSRALPTASSATSSRYSSTSSLQQGQASTRGRVFGPPATLWVPEDNPTYPYTIRKLDEIEYYYECATDAGQRKWCIRYEDDLRTGAPSSLWTQLGPDHTEWYQIPGESSWSRTDGVPS